LFFLKGEKDRGILFFVPVVLSCYDSAAHNSVESLAFAELWGLDELL